ncbi:MAG: alginate lyase family protein [Ignavibacteria bacterium]|nr:alginate lyase family protein [Ignavibacteria bacterium]
MNCSIPVKALVVFLLMTWPAFAQLKLSDRSQLKNAEYHEHQIKTISDSDLFKALVLDQTGLKDVEQAAGRRDFVRAYQAWGAWWDARQQPRYATQTDKLLIDTEMLKGYDEIRAYATQHPAERDTVLARAALLLKNIFRPWGDVVVDFGPQVDFNREIGQSGKYGFHYWGWSRVLTSAYLMTGEQKYLAKFDELFLRWYDQRNSIIRGFPEFDVVYYELGLGVRNRMFIEYYFLPFQERSWQTHERMLKTMLGAGRWLYELERWEGYRSGNWQIHGSYMLAQLAMVFPEFRESSLWLNLALQRLEEHLRQDFFEDGGHSERAPRNYTQATYLTYRNLYYLLSTYHVREDLAQAIRQRMGNTIDWWITMLAPTGEIPAINDSHRGLFPTFILEDGAEFYKKPYVSGVLKNLSGVAPKAEALTFPPFVSRHMPASGFTVMRSDWTRDALYMNINYGKWSGSHTHSDMLDFEIYAYGKALAVDAGIGLTYDDPLYIPWYKSSRAHNMVTVNDRNMEREFIEGENIKWSSSPLLEYFSGEHRGYETLGVRHRRQILFVSHRYWLILDDVKCEKGGDTLSWYFHTPTTLVRDGREYHSTGQPGILVYPLTGGESPRTGTSMASSTSDLTPGKTEEINWIAFDQISRAAKTLQYNVLLFPYRDQRTPIEHTAISETHFRIKSPEGVDDLYVSSGLTSDGEIETDAPVLLLHREGNQTVRYSLVDGTYLRVGGKQIWSSTKRVAAEGIVPN